MTRNGLELYEDVRFDKILCRHCGKIQPMIGLSNPLMLKLETYTVKLPMANVIKYPMPHMQMHYMMTFECPECGKKLIYSIMR